MRLKVIDADEWFARRERDAFGSVETDEQRRGKPGCVCRRHRVDLFDGTAGFRQRLLNNRLDQLQVIARSQFGHNAPIRAMERYLGADDVRQDFAALAYDGGGRFVARSLNAQYVHGSQARAMITE